MGLIQIQNLTINLMSRINPGHCRTPLLVQSNFPVASFYSLPLLEQIVIKICVESNEDHYMTKKCREQ